MQIAVTASYLYIYKQEQRAWSVCVGALYMKTKLTMSEDDGGLGRSWTRAEDRIAIRNRHTKVTYQTFFERTIIRFSH